MRAHEFLFEQSLTDQDAQLFLTNLLASSYSLKINQLSMKSILKSLLDQGYLRDARWVLNTINNMPDDPNLIVDKQMSDSNKVVFSQDEGAVSEPLDEPAEQPDSDQVVDQMAQQALDRRIK
jgi:hypothetical protein